jgi:hypothetical protein
MSIHTISCDVSASFQVEVSSICWGTFMSSRKSFVVGLIAIVIIPVIASSQGAAPPLNRVEVVAHQTYGAAQTNQLIDDVTALGGKARRITITNPAAQPWQAGLNSIITSDLKRGDRIEATVMMRTPPQPATGDTPASSPKPGTVKVLFQLNDAPYTEFSSSTANVPARWTAFRLKGRAPEDLPRGKARIALQLGYGSQIIDVGPILVVKQSR